MPAEKIKEDRRSLSLERYRSGLAERPSPESILGLVCSKGGMISAQPSAGLPAYQIDPCIADPAAVFVESAPMPAYRLRRNAIAIPGIVMLITGGMLLPGFGAVDVLSSIVTVFVFGLIALAGTLGFTWFAWRMTPWPIVIQRHQGDRIVRLAGRKPWCLFRDLSPSFTVGRLDFVSDPRDRSPMKPRKLPPHLRSRDQVAWLRLEWPSRVRWVILSIHENEDQALASLVAWGEKLGLNAADAHTAEPPPSLSVFTRARRLF